MAVVPLASVSSRRFGRLGWRVKPVGLGGAWLGHESGRDESVQVVVDAVRAGVDFIDTAIRYGDSELLIGEALRQLPPDQWPRIATKAQVVDDRADIADAVVRSCEESLKRLGVPRVDLFQLHEAERYGDRVLGPGGALEGLRRCRDAGYCTGIGITGRPPQALTPLVRTGEFDAVLTYLHYDLLTRDATDELIPAAVAHDVAVIAGSPSRMGMFATPSPGRWAREPAEHLARRDALEALFGKPAAALAGESLRYLLADERLATIVVGVAQREIMAETVASALAGPLDARTCDRVRAIAGPAA